MERTYGTCGRRGGLFINPEVNRPVRRPGHRDKDYIIVHVKDMG